MGCLDSNTQYKLELFASTLVAVPSSSSSFSANVNPESRIRNRDRVFRTKSVVIEVKTPKALEELKIRSVKAFQLDFPMRQQQPRIMLVWTNPKIIKSPLTRFATGEKMKMRIKKEKMTMPMTMNT